MVHALSRTNSEVVDCLKTPVIITVPGTNQQIDTLGIWDTGATNSVITKSVAQKLSLQVVQMANVRGVHGVKPVPVYMVDITLNNQNIIVKSLVTECDELAADESVGMLIGMNIITMGDLSISNFNNSTVLTFRVPSLECIDYVTEISEHNKLTKMFAVRSKHGNDKCPCGCGKKFENCHGRSKYNR